MCRIKSVLLMITCFVIKGAFVVRWFNIKNKNTTRRKNIEKYLLLTTCDLSSVRNTLCQVCCIASSTLSSLSNYDIYRILIGKLNTISLVKH